MLLMRCAILKTVLPLNRVHNVCWMNLSVSESIEALASSNTSIFGLLSKHLHKQISCF